MKAYLSAAWKNKQIRTIVITAVVTAILFGMCGCKKEAPTCQNCVVQDYLLTGTGFNLIGTSSFIDCSLKVRNEDRTYQEGDYVKRKIVRCQPN